jgi:hypothetical protein
MDEDMADGMIIPRVYGNFLLLAYLSLVLSALIFFMRRVLFLRR